MPSAISWLRRPDIRERLWQERATEPFLVNLASLWFALFGSTRDKIRYDLIPLQYYAFSVDKAAELARKYGSRGVSLLEFGVAGGRGLLNLCEISRRVHDQTKTEFRIYGFDGGSGMPPPRDYRDHPDLYAAGDFPMDRQRLIGALPSNAKLYLGDLQTSIETFFGEQDPEFPIGFVSIDLDYYWSTKEAMNVFRAPSSAYLPLSVVYFDDIADDEHNEWCGEKAAIREFNSEIETRKLEHSRFLRNKRMLKNAWWLEQIFFLHVFDHPVRNNGIRPEAARGMFNPFLPA